MGGINKIIGETEIKIQTPRYKLSFKYGSAKIQAINE
jgi:hypothetical protein